MKYEDSAHPASEPMINRYARRVVIDDNNDIDCDVVYTDRLTGEEVLRYDGGDPANRPPLGPSDEDVFLSKGLSIDEEIPVTRCKVPPSSFEVSSWAAKKAMKVERQQEFKRGTDLLLETDLFTYLDLDGAAFNYEAFSEEEVSKLKPALEAKGFSMVSFSHGERDSFGPLSRIVRAVRDDKGYLFVYG